ILKQEFWTQPTKSLGIKVQLEKVSQDHRIKEWIVLKSKGGQVNMEKSKTRKKDVQDVIEDKVWCHAGTDKVSRIQDEPLEETYKDLVDNEVNQEMICNPIRIQRIEEEKVKGHSNILENDIADSLAKKGAREDNEIRSSINKIALAVVDIEWANLRSSKYWIEKKEGKNQIVWKETWKDIENFKEGNCIDKGKNRDWIFWVKYLNEALPTMDKLNKRNPDLYESSICIACGAEEETQDHLVTYQEHQTSWNRTKEEAFDDTNNLEEVRESIRDKVFGTNQQEKFEVREELMRDLLSTERKERMENLVQNGKKKTKIV
ncbi:11025_t:CDS:2, partial [Gigaspora margarita]